MEKKIQTKFIDYGLGFPVTLLDVPMVKFRGHWTPRIKYSVYHKDILLQLSRLDSRLTGAHVRFIRTYFEMTLQEFAKRFVVTHPAVIKWEGMGQKPTGMNWSTEKDIRLFIMDELKVSPKKFQSSYQKLEKVTKKRAVKLEVAGEKIAA